MYQYQVMVLKSQKIGTVIRESDFDRRKHPNAMRKPRHIAGRKHCLVKFEDGSEEWYSKYEIKETPQ